MSDDDFETTDDIAEHIDWVRLSDNLPDEEDPDPAYLEIDGGFA